MSSSPVDSPDSLPPNSPYSILIQWSPEDEEYIVTLPEFGPYTHTYGATYEEALASAKNALETLKADYAVGKRALPEPQYFRQD